MTRMLAKHSDPTVHEATITYTAMFKNAVGGQEFVERALRGAAAGNGLCPYCVEFSDDRPGEVEGQRQITLRGPGYEPSLLHAPGPVPGLTVVGGREPRA